MELQKFVVLLTAFGLFAAVVLSTLVTVLMLWLPALVASFQAQERKKMKRTAEVRRLAGQEGV